MNLREVIKNLPKEDKIKITNIIKNSSAKHIIQSENANLCASLGLFGMMHIWNLMELADDYIETVITRDEIIELLRS